MNYDLCEVNPWRNDDGSWEWAILWEIGKASGATLDHLVERGWITQEVANGAVVVELESTLLEIRESVTGRPLWVLVPVWEDTTIH